MMEFLLLLLPAALGSGWYMGKSNKPSPREGVSTKIPRDYFVGLNFLLEEQPDKAVDVFIKMLEVDSETVDTHLALGSLFRRRGEVDRAIRIHQNVIARPHLAKQQRVQALLALGQDYLRAGVFDRAERLFLEVVEMGEQSTLSLRFLLDIYQQEKNWQQAIQIAQKLATITTEKMNVRIAHYYCELAIEARDKGQLEQAQKHLKQALVVDKRCVRASLLIADHEKQMGQFKQAIRFYQQVKDQDPEYLSEAINPLAECYEKLGKEEELIEYLQQCLTQYPRMSVVLALAEILKRYQGHADAASFIADQLRTTPSVRGLHQLIRLQLVDAEGPAKENLSILYDLTIKLLKNKPIYRCEQCGFHGKVLHWLCPSCKGWSTVKPIHGLEGD
jgi:lipopolysaccharide biosynthesis regulator YciM